MFLLLWGTFLTVCSQLVSPVVSWLVSLTCSITEYELQLRQEIRDMRRELARTSMQVQYRVITITSYRVIHPAGPVRGVRQDREENQQAHGEAAERHHGQISPVL